MPSGGSAHPVLELREELVAQAGELGQHPVAEEVDGGEDGEDPGQDPQGLLLDLGQGLEDGDREPQGEGGEVRFPERIVQALRGAHTRMRGATRLLRARRPEKALELQRQAQEMLEQARTGRTTEPADTGRRGVHELSGVEAKGVRTNGMIKPNRSQDAAEFRQRVLEGLGQPKAERLAPAVRRYAEELLK